VLNEAPSPLITQAVMTEATKRLSGFVGEGAREMVRQAAATANDPGELYQALAQHISQPIEREAFLGWVEHERPEPPPPRVTLVPATQSPAAAPPPSPATGVSDADVATITKALIPHLGPIAGHLVKRENQAGRSREELCRVLAQRIPSPADRTAFLRQMRAE
jgi:serine/threonine-protein kinase